MPAFLVAESGHTAELAARTVRVGSDARADVAVRAELGVAAFHYELVPTAQGYLVRALQPELPVLVNGAPRVMAELNDGDVISVGALKLMFRHVVDAPVTAMERPAVVPMGGYRVPDEMRRPDESPHDESELANMSEAARKKWREQKLMTESLEHTRKHLEGLRSQQDFNSAVLMAIIALGLGFFVFGKVNGLMWKLYVPAMLGLGCCIGWAVRVSGKGIDKRFGYLAACAALSVALLSNFLRFSGVVESHDAVADAEEITEAKASDYGEDAAIEAARRMAVTASAHQEQIAQTHLAVQAGGEKIAEDLFDYGARELPAEVEEAPAPPKDASTSVGTSLSFVMIMFGPKALVAYLLLAGTAYRSAFKFLSNKEASDLHSSDRRARDTSGLTLRERVLLK